MKAPAERKLKGNEIIIKDVSFMQSAYMLDIVELRLVALAIIVMRQESGFAKFDPTIPVTIHANLYSSLFGTTKQNAYISLENAAKSLHERIINWVDIYEGKNGKKSQRINDLRWTSQCSYVPSQGLVQLCFSPQVIPFLIHIDKNFAGYEIRNLMKLSTHYEFRLYELAVAWKNTGIATFNKETLRHRLGILDENLFPRLDNFHRMLNKAVTSINKNTDLMVDITPVHEFNGNGQKGKRVNSYTMKVMIKNRAVEDSMLEKLNSPELAVEPINPSVLVAGADSFLFESNGQVLEAEHKVVENPKPVESQPEPVKPRSKKEQPLQARPNDNGEWDYDFIVKNINKPHFQIIGMDENSIPDALIEQMDEYKKFADKNVEMAKQIVRTTIARKIVSNLRLGQGVAPNAMDEAGRQKVKHGHTKLDKTQMQTVLMNGAFVARYAPIGESNPIMIRATLTALLTGDLSKIPDLNDYL